MLPYILDPYTCVYNFSSGHSQILSCSCWGKLGEGLGTKLVHVIYQSLSLPRQHIEISLVQWSMNSSCLFKIWGEQYICFTTCLCSITLDLWSGPSIMQLSSSDTRGICTWKVVMWNVLHVCWIHETILLQLVWTTSPQVLNLYPPFSYFYITVVQMFELPTELKTAHHCISMANISPW